MIFLAFLFFNGFGAPLIGDVRNCNNITVKTRIGADRKERKMPAK
jgi:hypothetical protein